MTNDPHRAKKVEIVNAIIREATIGFDRGFILSAWLHLDYGGAGQGFGGYVLGGDPYGESRVAQHAEQPNIAGEWIASILAVAGVEQWSELVGKVVRVECESGRVTGIGHPVKDKWFRPSTAPALLAAAKRRGHP